MSRNTPKARFPADSASSMRAVSRWIAADVDEPRVKPN